MWRATMMALGLCMILLGGEAMIVDRVVMADSRTDIAQNNPFPSNASSYNSYDRFASYDAGFTTSARRIFVPPDWAPWGLLSAGALTFLYSTALPGGRASND